MTSCHLCKVFESMKRFSYFYIFMSLPSIPKYEPKVKNINSNTTTSTTATIHLVKPGFHPL